MLLWVMVLRRDWVLTACYRRARDLILGLDHFSYDLSHIVDLLIQRWVIVLIICMKFHPCT